MRQRVGTPFGGNEPAGFDQILDLLGAVEVEAPEHWRSVPAPKTGFAIYLEGRNVERPDWNRKEALALAHTVIGFRGWLIRQRQLAKGKGKPLPVALPKWHGIAVCLICHELQIVQSNATKGDLCWACQGRCRQKHRSNARTCDECKSEVQVLWTIKQDIPGEWQNG